LIGGGGATAVVKDHVGPGASPLELCAMIRQKYVVFAARPAGVNVGDVSPDGRKVRHRVVLDPATTKGGRMGEVFLPARLVTKLRRFLAWKRRAGQSLTSDAPLFVTSQRRRLSPRAAQWRFAWWQRRAGFDRHYGFHQLRHSAVTNVYRASRDLFLAQRFAHHASPLTTVAYTHPSDEEMYQTLRNLRC